MAPTVRRLGDGPIITPHMDTRMGDNICGPSLIRVPDWAPAPLGRFYLYFADHRGAYIRLAYADAVEGPWKLHGPGCLDVEDSHFATERPESGALTGDAATWFSQGHDFFYPHIASPDVHVPPDRREFRMYFHGLMGDGNQLTRVATSSDGLSFTARPEILGHPYFRAFRHGDWHYAVSLYGCLYRSADGLGAFEEGPRLLADDARHPGLLARGDKLYLFWTRVGDAPEGIVCSTVGLEGDWRRWSPSPPVDVLKPERDWEGASEPPRPSILGAADGPVNELRDPCLFEDDGRTYLLYSGAGERCIGLVEIDL